MAKARRPVTVSRCGSLVVSLGRKRVTADPSHAESRTTRVETTVSTVGDRAASAMAAINGSNERQSPRLEIQELVALVRGELFLVE
jgi:hypothetical protein